MAQDLLFPSAFGWPRRWMDLFDGDSFMRVEEIEQDGVLLVRAELPGVDPEEDVELTVDNGMLTLHAERHEEKEQRAHRRRRSEFRYGSFSRSIPLPAGATEDDVKAVYKNGILEVRIPLVEHEAEAKKVPILTV
jgi:HSP20 family protein